MIDRSMSICNACARTDCVWRTTGLGIDPPIMGHCDNFVVIKPAVAAPHTTPIRQRHSTNADRIRAMSNEELANIVCCCNHKSGDDCFDASCYDCTLDWLRQPAEGGGGDG